MVEVVERLTGLKELLKKVSGTKPGHDQCELIGSFVEAHFSKDSKLKEAVRIHENQWEKQLKNGIIEPIYEIYRAALKDALTEGISNTIKDFDNKYQLVPGENGCAAKNSPISPLIAIYSQFSNQRISIYPFPEHFWVLNTLQRVIRLDKKQPPINNQHIVLNNLDDYLSQLRMSQALYAIERHDQKEGLFSLERPTDIFPEKERGNVFKALYERHYQNVPNCTCYLEWIKQNYTKLHDENEQIDFALSSLLTDHQNIYVFDLSFSQDIFAHRSIVLLVKEEAKEHFKQKENEWEHLVYKIDHALSRVLAFESNLRTYDIFLRSSDFVLKRDQSNWQRINKQIDFIKIVQKEIDSTNSKNEDGQEQQTEQQAQIDEHFILVPQEKNKRRVLESLSGLLPQIHESISAGSHSAYRMPQYFSKPFRTLLLKEGVFEPKKAYEIYKNILRVVKECFYDFKVNPSISPEDYIREHCIGKFKDRLFKSVSLTKALLEQPTLSKADKSEKANKPENEPIESYLRLNALKTLEKLFSDEYYEIYVDYKISINDDLIEYYGTKNFDIKGQIEQICRDRTFDSSAAIKMKFSDFASKLENWERNFKPSPDDIRLIHGDLHFDNILVDAFDLSHPIDRLIDPGDFFQKGGDVSYDLGKLMHSFNGLYDFIHEGLYKLYWDELMSGNNKVLKCNFHIIADEHIFKKPIGSGGSGANVDRFSPLYGGEIVNYLYIKEQNDRIVKEIFTGFNCDKLIQRARFNEAMHFLTMAPFHIKEDPKRTLAIVITGMILMWKWKTDLSLH